MKDLWLFDESTTARRFVTCLDLSAPGFDGVTAPIESFADVWSGSSNQLLLQFAVDALHIFQFRLLGDQCLRLLDQISLNCV